MSGGLVDRLRAKLVRLFDEHRVVVWRDPSGLLERTLRAALPAGVEMPPFAGNPLSLRQQIDRKDPWLDGARWLLYVPRLPEGVRCWWLADYERGFLQVADGTLSYLVRELYDVDVPPEIATYLTGPAVEKLLAHFDETYRAGPPADPDEVILGLLRAALGEPAMTAMEVVLQYVVSEPDEAALREAGLLPALTRLIQSRLGLRRRMTEGAAPDKNEIVRCLVASALVVSGAAEAKALSNQLPDVRHRDEWAKALDQGLLQDNERVLRTLVRTAVDGSKLAKAAVDPMALALGPSLAFVDARMLELLRERPDADPASPAHHTFLQEARAVAEQRVGIARLEPQFTVVWRALATAAAMLTRMHERELELQRYPADCAEQMANEYLRVGGADQEIDTSFRSLPPSSAKLPELVASLVTAARERYFRFVRVRAERFTDAAALRPLLKLRSVPSQRTFFRDMVERSQGRTAVVLVDALRSDLANELAARLRERHRAVDLEPHFAELPTRTEVGMAALLPGAEREDAFRVRVEGGRLIAEIGDERVAGAAERRQYLARWASRTGTTIDIATVDAFLADPSRLAAAIETGALAVAWTTEIDEAGPIASAVSFDVVGQVLEKCATLIDSALSSGFDEVVVATDHGFVLTDPNAAPGGVGGTQAAGGEFARGLRYAAGLGETGDLLSLPAKKLGRTGADVFVPRGSACLALQGGAGLFVHGGLSLEECVLQFLRVQPGDGRRRRAILIRLEVPAAPTSLVFRVELHADSTPGATARRVRLVARDFEDREIWASPAIDVSPSGEAWVHAETVRVKGGGYYRIVLEDFASSAVLEQREVHVEVLGEDFF